MSLAREKEKKRLQGQEKKKAMNLYETFYQTKECITEWTLQEY